MKEKKAGEIYAAAAVKKPGAPVGKKSKAIVPAGKVPASKNKFRK